MTYEKKLLKKLKQRLTVIYANDKATSFAKFGVQMVKAPYAKRLAFSHNVPLASKWPRAFCTSKMS